MKTNIEENRFIIGIGGVFFKAEDPKNLQSWYMNNLGFSSQVPYSNDDDAITFAWKSLSNENENTVWAPFKNDTDYFNPSKKDWMINYIVRDIEGLLNYLISKGIKPIDELKTYLFGKFVHILDPEGNKIEFWEPNKEFFKNKY